MVLTPNRNAKRRQRWLYENGQTLVGHHLDIVREIRDLADRPFARLPG
ncbi:MAG: hypothetical protein LBS60_13705 [Deltaproteobacteria bacterium]|nr:hypothetical protein [Deltaproteobacteria bacterium]